MKLTFVTGNTEVSAGEAVRMAIDNAPDYYAGQLESVCARLDKLMSVLSSVVDSLPAEAQRAIVESQTYQFTEKK